MLEAWILFNVGGCHGKIILILSTLIPSTEVQNDNHYEDDDYQDWKGDG